MGGQEARASGQPCVGLIEVGESGVLLPAVREAILADDAELASGYEASRFRRGARTLARPLGRGCCARQFSRRLLLCAVAQARHHDCGPLHVIHQLSHLVTARLRHVQPSERRAERRQLGGRHSFCLESIFHPLQTRSKLRRALLQRTHALPDLARRAHVRSRGAKVRLRLLRHESLHLAHGRLGSCAPLERGLACFVNLPRDDLPAMSLTRPCVGEGEETRARG